MRDIRVELILLKLREKEVDSKTTVSDAEIASYIEHQRGSNVGLTKNLRIEHILLKISLNALETEIEVAR